MTVEAELRAVRVRYGLVEALHGVDLVCPAGRVTLLLGRNGAGRSTVLRTLAGAVRPTAGRVLWAGRDVTALPADRRARAGLALVPAERAVFAALTVAENLGPGIEAATGLFPELVPLLGRPAGSLSGGQQQMTALGRALGARPRLLLLDEPDRGLAPAVATRLHARLVAVAAEGRTVVVAAAAVPAALSAAGVVHVLRRGRVVFSGEPAELRSGDAGRPG
ncbi:ABC transporter ATP-binding protein [Kitasatospora sp. NPDC057015]|uniref:ABC transporter ATP-binding protein n=1 Tax=Kitasatospora sp. NPDC057015 TaxID=3346001 RepID=UPI00363A0B4A